MTKSNQAQVVPPYDLIPVSSGVPSADVDLPDNTRGLLVGTAGSLNITMENGEQRDAVPFVQGTNPGRFRQVRIGGTAQNVWAVV